MHLTSKMVYNDKRNLYKDQELDDTISNLGESCQQLYKSIDDLTRLLHKSRNTTEINNLCLALNRDDKVLQHLKAVRTLF
jgi:hypothetical protein